MADQNSIGPHVGWFAQLSQQNELQLPPDGQTHRGTKDGAVSVSWQIYLTLVTGTILSRARPFL